MAYGLAVGLELVEQLTAAPMLKHYHLLSNLRADLLAKVGRSAEAHAEYLCAAALTNNTREHTLLLERAENVLKQGNEP